MHETISFLAFCAFVGLCIATWSAYRRAPRPAPLPPRADPTPHPGPTTALFDWGRAVGDHRFLVHIESAARRELEIWLAARPENRAKPLPPILQHLAASRSADAWWRAEIARTYRGPRPLLNLWIWLVELAQSPVGRTTRYLDAVTRSLEALVT